MKRGFTFIEILVVVVIIGLLIGISTFGVQNARQSSLDTRREADIANIQSGLARFKADCFSYPTEAELSAAMTAGKLVGIASKAPNCRATNTYIEKLSNDPEAPTYVYFYDQVDDDNYILCASLATAPNPAQSTTGCTSCGSRACNIKVTN